MIVAILDVINSINTITYASRAISKYIIHLSISESSSLIAIYEIKSVTINRVVYNTIIKRARVIASNVANVDITKTYSSKRSVSIDELDDDIRDLIAKYMRYLTSLARYLVIINDEEAYLVRYDAINDELNIEKFAS